MPRYGKHVPGTKEPHDDRVPEKELPPASK